jgi:hypothetical protein
MSLPSIDKIATAVGGEVSAGEVLAPGPGHSPADRSLSVKPDPDAPDGFLVHSFSGDDPIACRDHVRSKLGLPEWKPNGDGKANDRNTSRANLKAAAKPYSPTVATFVYRDQDGRPYLQVRRTAAKDFFQSHWTGENWKSGAPKGPKVPFRLSELIAAPPNVPVYIVEGEGKAELLAKLGFVATSASGGAGKWSADLNEWFRDRHVRILIDNDAPGRKHGQSVAEKLDGTPASVRLIELPGLPPKGDVKEWLQNDPTGARLVQICERTPVWEPTVGTTAKDEEAIGELAALAPLDYAKRRKGAAEAIGIGVGELDAIVSKARGESSVRSCVPARWAIERWDETVDTAELLSTTARHVRPTPHPARARRGGHGALDSARMGDRRRPCLPVPHVFVAGDAVRQEHGAGADLPHRAAHRVRQQHLPGGGVSLRRGQSADVDHRRGGHVCPWQ